ncbi:MAG: hypothetical protein R2751_02570 [Bacteroidales bacterium]
MGEAMERLLAMRGWRHFFFWCAWVLGFTLIKSMGAVRETFYGWFSYYMITLPLFVAHTYLVAYVLIPRFHSRWRILWFILFFLMLFYGFSFLESLLSHGFIYKWYQTGVSPVERYLSFGNVVKSGLGNLYIVLVFVSARTIRNWYQAGLRQQELQQAGLRQNLEEQMTRIQPGMLLFAVDRIHRMVKTGHPEITHAIALTSELLSEVMMYNDEFRPLLSREIELVKKLIALSTLLRGKAPEVEFFISGDPGEIDLPPMILFSLVDVVLRMKDPLVPEMNIEASGYSNLISVQLLVPEEPAKREVLDAFLGHVRSLEAYYGDRVRFSQERPPYGCQVLVTKRPPESVTAASRRKAVVHRSESAPG